MTEESTREGLGEVAGLPAEQLRVFVGPRADYYLKQWTLEEASTQGFNWAAFLFCGLWIAYRKMWLIVLCLWAALLVETSLEDLLFIQVLGMSDTPRALFWGVTVALASLVGAFGNRLYLLHARRIFARARSRYPAEPQQSAYLARRGGTSMIKACAITGLAVLGYAILYVIVGILMGVPPDV